MKKLFVSFLLITSSINVFAATVATVSVINHKGAFTDASKDHYANGLSISEDKHSAKIWIDDVDADVAVQSTTPNGAVCTVAINTVGEFGTSPYVSMLGDCADVAITKAIVNAK